MRPFPLCSYPYALEDALSAHTGCATGLPAAARLQATPQEAVDPCSVVNLYLTHHVVDTLSGADQCHHAFSLSC